VDAEFILAYSDDLEDWDDSESMIDRSAAPVANPDGVTETITVRISVAAEDGGDQGFWQLTERFVED
jgi:hypothetical protein